MFYFCFGMSLMLNLIFIFGLFKFYKKIFKSSKESSLKDLEKQFNLTFFSTNDKSKEKEDNKNNNDLNSIFRSSSDINDFWK